jgi:hypothetical protein
MLMKEGVGAGSQGDLARNSKRKFAPRPSFPAFYGKELVVKPFTNSRMV